MSIDIINMIALTLLIISTIIGACFATGAELVVFFGSTGLPPAAIAIFVGIFLFAIMAVLVFFAHKNQNHILKHAFTAVYFAIFVVMTAGLMHLGGTITTVLALVFCIFVVLYGFERLLFVNKYSMYFVLAILLTATATNLKGTGDILGGTEPDLGRGLGMALLYAGMNCCLLGPVFSSALVKNSRRRVLVSCALATVIICILATLIMTAIRKQGVSAEMPLLELSNNLVTKAAVFLSIITSMMICLYNIVTSFPHSKTPADSPLAKGGAALGAGGACLIAFGLSFLGFAKALGIFYPVIGACMILYVLGLVLLRCGKFFRHHFFVINNSVDRLQIVKNE